METFVAVLVTLIGALPGISGWWGERSARGRKRIALREIAARVEVLETWIRAQRSLPDCGSGSSGFALAQEELASLLQAYREVSRTDRDMLIQERDEISWFRRGLLLYKMRGASQVVLQLGFYLVLVFAAFAFIGALIPESSTDPSFTVISENPAVLLVILPFAVVLLILQRTADRMRFRRTGRDRSS